MTETLDDGWIEWHGGECSPVAAGAIGYVRFRDGEIGEGLTWDWSHGGKDSEYEIVAYKLMSALPAQSEELERFARQVWELLNHLAELNNGQILVSCDTTANEAFLDIVREYRTSLADKLMQESE